MAPDSTEPWAMVRRLDAIERDLTTNGRRLDTLERLDLARFVALQDERMRNLNDTVRALAEQHREDARTLKVAIDAVRRDYDTLESDRNQRAGQGRTWRNIQAIVATVVAVVALLVTVIAFFYSRSPG